MFKNRILVSGHHSSPKSKCSGIKFCLLVIAISQNQNFHNLKDTGFWPSLVPIFKIQIFEIRVLILLIAILQNFKFKISDFGLAEIYTDPEEGLLFQFQNGTCNRNVLSIDHQL